MLFSKLLNRGHARPGYGTDPFSGVEMPLHEDVPDGLIDVAESKHQKEGRVEIEVGEIHLPFRGRRGFRFHPRDPTKNFVIYEE